MVIPMLHERTKEKFRLCGSDWSEKLKEQIDDDNLPQEYGGIALFEGFSQPN